METIWYREGYKQARIDRYNGLKAKFEYASEGTSWRAKEYIRGYLAGYKDEK